MRGKHWGAALAGVAGLLISGTTWAQQPGGVATAAASDKVAAVVNGQQIRFSEVETIIRSRGPLPVEISADKRKALQRDVLFMMIDNMIMEQFLRQDGPRIDPQEVARRMAELEAAVKKAGKTMQDYYRDTQQSEQQVRASIAQMLQWEGYSRGRVNDADVQAYYTQNKDFFDGITVRASHILIRIPVTAGDGDRQAARQRLLAIRANIVANQIDFVEAAKKYSECPSAKDGGDIGSFPRKMVVDENFARAAFAMKIGDVSDVVATDFGLHIIKVTDRKPGEQPSEFAKIKDVVRDFCIEEMRQNLLGQLRQKGKIEIFLDK